MLVICLCLLSCVHLCATPWTVARQAPLSIGFHRQEYWSGLPFPPTGDLDPEIEPCLLGLLHRQASSLPLSSLGSPVMIWNVMVMIRYSMIRYGMEWYAMVWYDIDSIWWRHNLGDCRNCISTGTPVSKPASAASGSSLRWVLLPVCWGISPQDLEATNLKE